ncbi:hypothetical protein L207DRAFT_611713 [Hyaloscypha variabilis F]|uniref:Uncharacterized protein n=1 Tax=Hyaloscypha variabilis (strain UAMH 11265 / GT02V1 / F) TaxID=1149755 RepID=A0A2J6QXM3_HYAVF|nr:hypothetical protein L207DRAFT_611713 [Hyaloscypha variabilis F]
MVSSFHISRWYALASSYMFSIISSSFISNSSSIICFFLIIVFSSSSMNSSPNLLSRTMVILSLSITSPTDILHSWFMIDFSFFSDCSSILRASSIIGSSNQSSSIIGFCIQSSFAASILLINSSSIIASLLLHSEDSYIRSQPSNFIPSPIIAISSSIPNSSSSLHISSFLHSSSIISSSISFITICPSLIEFSCSYAIYSTSIKNRLPIISDLLLVNSFNPVPGSEGQPQIA